MLSRWENPTRAIPPRIPPETDPNPNQAEPYKDSEPPLARRPCVARATHGARTVSYRKHTVLIIRGGPGEMEVMEEGENLAHTIPTSNPDPDQEQGGLGVWCGVKRQRAEYGSNKKD